MRVSLLLLLVFGFLALALTYPLAFQAGNTIANYGDPLLNSWILAWDAHQLILNPLDLFNANIFHPYPATLAYSEHLLGIAIPFAPVLWATGNPILAHNLALLSSFVLSGFGAYLLVRYLTGSRYAGLVAGIAFAYAPYRLTGISQLQNLTVQWLPFTFLFLTRSFRGRSTRDVWLFALFFTLQALSCMYYAFYTALAVGLYLAFRLWLSWRNKSLRTDWALWKRLALALGATAVLLALVFLPYLTARTTVGERGLEGQDGASLRDYVTVSPRSVIGLLVPATQPQSDQGKILFPGLILMVLAIPGVAVGLRCNRNSSAPPAKGRDRNASRPGCSQEPCFYLILVLIGFVLSLGTSLHLSSTGPTVLEPLPYAFLVKWVPGFSAMRVPARLALLVVFAVTVLAGYGAAQLARSRVRWLAFLVAALLLVDVVMLPQPNRPIEVGAQVPQVYRWLNQAPAASVVLELPSVTSPWFWQDTASMERLGKQQYFSTYHWHPTIMGYSGFVPPLFWESLDRILHFPSTEALSFLRGMDVRYLILHRAEFGSQEWSTLERRLALFADQLSPVQTLGDDIVYALAADDNKTEMVGARLPRPSVKTAPKMSLYLPDVARRGKEYVAYVIITNPNDSTLVHTLPPKYRLSYRWRNAEPMVGAKSPRPPGTPGLWTDAREGYFPMTLPEGISVVPLEISPVPGAQAQLELALSVLGQELSGTQTVRTQESPVPPPSETGLSAHPFFAADLDFGNGLELTHVALDSDHYRAGDSVGLTMYWHKSTEGPLDGYVVFFRLVEEQRPTHVITQDDVPMARSGLWDKAGYATDHRLQQLPLDLPPGEYRLVLGLYDVQHEQFVPAIQEDGTRKWDAFQAKIVVE